MKRLEKGTKCWWCEAYYVMCEAWWKWNYGVGMCGCHGSLGFIDDVTADKISSMNLKCRAILSAHIQSDVSKLIRQHFTVQIGIDPSHTVKESQNFLKAEPLNVLQWSNQSPHLNPAEGTLPSNQAVTEDSCCKDLAEPPGKKRNIL